MACGIVIELKRDARPQDGAQPVLQAQQSADHLLDEHAGAGRGPAARAQPRHDPAPLHCVSPRGGAATHRVRTAEGAGPGPHPRRAKIALDNLDEVIATIRRSQTQDSAQKNLHREIQALRVQAKAILAIQLARLAAMERKKIIDEYTEVLKTIARPRRPAGKSAQDRRAHQG